MIDKEMAKDFLKARGSSFDDDVLQYIEQIEAEVARLKEIAAGADDGGHWYSHQTMQAVVAEREELRTRCQQLEAQLALGIYPRDWSEPQGEVEL